MMLGKAGAHQVWRRPGDTYIPEEAMALALEGPSGRFYSNRQVGQAPKLSLQTVRREAGRLGAIATAKKITREQRQEWGRKGQRVLAELYGPGVIQGRAGARAQEMRKVRKLQEEKDQKERTEADGDVPF